MTASAVSMVNMDGPPAAVAWNQSPTGGKEVNVFPERLAVAGGTKLREAKRVWMVMMRVGGRESRRMRMAMASRRGQELRIVAARARVLLAELVIDVLYARASETRRETLVGCAVGCSSA